MSEFLFFFHRSLWHDSGRSLLWLFIYPRRHMCQCARWTRSVCWLYSLTRILNVFTYTISVGGYESKLSLYVVCKFFLYTSFFIIGFTIKTLEQTFKRGNSPPEMSTSLYMVSDCPIACRVLGDRGFFLEENESVFWQWIFIFDI